jgi:ribonuclease HI
VVEHGALNVDFKTRTAIKSQALVDFMLGVGKSTNHTNKATRALGDVLQWLTQPRGHGCRGTPDIFWNVSNNEAEYEALLHRLRLAISLGIKRLLVHDDFVVVIKQVNDSWDRNKENMDTYCLEVCKLENKLHSLEFHHDVLDNNVAADILSKLGSTRAQVPAGVSSTNFTRHPFRSRH